MVKTEICNLLNIEYPIIQGGMAWVSTAELVSAVSNAGGLGIIGGGQMPPDMLKNEIRKTKEMTDKPFGVNVMLLDAETKNRFEILLKEKVPVVTTGAGNPGPFISEVKENGMKIIPVCPSVALAQRVERQGADAVIVEGMEAGGHIGESTTFALVPQVADGVNIPVIAAGGIADGRGLVAALVLGAKGVQIGTRFICSTECTAHQNFKDKVLKAKDRDTVVTGRATGHPVRVLKNKLSRAIDLLDKEDKGEEIEKLGIGKLRLAVVEGDAEWGSLMAGQNSGLVKEIKTAGEIINEIINDATTIINNINKLSGNNTK